MFKNNKKTIILLSFSFILFLIILFKNNYFVINRLESSVNTMSYTEISKKALDSTYYFNNMNYSSSYDMSDPFFLKEGSSYYIYSTSCSGIKISKSTNFQKWNFVTKTALDLNNSELDMSNYVCYWAPEVYKYNNKYYMFFTSVDKNNNHRILVAQSLKPEGPFTNAKDVGSKIKNVIDATVFFDTDGRKYMISKNEDNGNIYIEELNNDAPVGKDPLKYLGLATTLYELDIHKHRNNDCYYHIGFAYEIGAILNRKVTLPENKYDDFSIIESQIKEYLSELNKYHATNFYIHPTFNHTINDIPDKITFDLEPNEKIFRLIPIIKDIDNPENVFNKFKLGIVTTSIKSFPCVDPNK